MKIFKDCNTMSEALGQERKKGTGIGFVPTMGYLHEGHLSLIREIRNSCEQVVVSIFVNPLQFNDPSDFEKYPVDLERDFELLRKEGVEYVFTPAREIIYNPSNQSRVHVSELTKPLEGRFRPGHFEGVTTVVSILFNIIRPDIAIFGEKDFQQLRIVEQLVTDLHIPVEIIRGKLIREADGLALSSRNVRLSDSARKNALSLSRALFAAKECVSKGERNVSVLKDLGQKIFNQNPDVQVEYFEIVREADLQVVSQLSNEIPTRALVAAFVDGVRLIDNVQLV